MGGRWVGARQRRRRGLPRQPGKPAGCIHSTPHTPHPDQRTRAAVGQRQLPQLGHVLEEEALQLRHALVVRRHDLQATGAGARASSSCTAPRHTTTAAAAVAAAHAGAGAAGAAGWHAARRPLVATSAPRPLTAGRRCGRGWGRRGRSAGGRRAEGAAGVVQGVGMEYGGSERGREREREFVCVQQAGRTRVQGGAAASPSRPALPGPACPHLHKEAALGVGIEAGHVALDQHCAVLQHSVHKAARGQLQREGRAGGPGWVAAAAGSPQRRQLRSRGFA